MSEVPGDERLIAGRYRLLSPLGQGGMGVVWRARDEALGREVAVKEVRAPAGLDDAETSRLYARLEREAWAAARISHRNVVTVYDVASQDGRPWIAMELIRGLTLAETLDAEGALAPQRAAHIGGEVLAALRAAHEAGVLHRDVKPGNVLIANDGRVVLTDFGIARVSGTSDLTMTGELIGSPEFLAPERALGRTPGPASDLWSLGVLLYACVEGNSPFRQDTPLSTLRAVVDEELPPPRRAGPLAPVIEGLLRKDPAERLPAAEAERLLRVVGAGGTPRTATVHASTPVPPVPYAPTETSTPTPPLPRPVFPAPSPGPDTTVSGTERPRRAVAVLTAGIAVLLVAVGALTYALVEQDGLGGTPAAGTTTSQGGTDPATDGPGPSPTPTPPSSPPSTPPSSAPATGASTGSTSASSTPPPAQTVRVHVAAVRDSYTGACPPPADRAPSFAAGITVGRVPASVSYRWVTESGGGSGAEWETVEFGAGGARERVVHHTETSFAADSERHDRIRVEIRTPAGARSQWVGFSVTCERETPTDGASSPGLGEHPYSGHR
ncbi:serine/threonine-protein kinase [Streptomyces purpureus]|uniref:serine/threonine-protein kinase n=1 Tax=Streptomyces purpureus TaxID=1951 RepID=UPI00035F030D|nr:serine/threonine-protein kinase [Streptomyces purpureus]